MEKDSTTKEAVHIAGEVREVALTGLPQGYLYAATRYADVILDQSFKSRFDDLCKVLSDFKPTLSELLSGGGGRSVFVKRFDDSLANQKENGQQVWGKQNVTIEKKLSLDARILDTSRTRSHEIDMFGVGSMDQPLPGVAVEMEWNNKDPFFDRDLINFQALHREGTIAVGVIVTRGPKLQELIGPTIRSKDGNLKYGQSTTHWEKLIPKVNLGGGGECPLLLIGIEPPRIEGIEPLQEAKGLLDEAREFKENWRSYEEYQNWSEAEPKYKEMCLEATNACLRLASKDVSIPLEP